MISSPPLCIHSRSRSHHSFTTPTNRSLWLDPPPPPATTTAQHNCGSFSLSPATITFQQRRGRERERKRALSTSVALFPPSLSLSAPPPPLFFSACVSCLFLPLRFQLAWRRGEDGKRDFWGRRNEGKKQRKKGFLHRRMCRERGRGGRGDEPKKKGERGSRRDVLFLPLSLSLSLSGVHFCPPPLPPPIQLSNSCGSNSGRMLLLLPCSCLQGRCGWWWGLLLLLHSSPSLFLPPFFGVWDGCVD